VEGLDQGLQLALSLKNPTQTIQNVACRLLIISALPIQALNGLVDDVVDKAHGLDYLAGGRKVDTKTVYVQ
ncbi:hypothetical protein C0991_004353, partial [Blastosporella zonata]